jgi:hypothetical protein
MQHRVQTMLRCPQLNTRRRLEGGSVRNPPDESETVTEGWLGFFLAVDSLCFFLPISVPIHTFSCRTHAT